MSLKKKDVFTTGQVAEICNVAPRTVTKWFDSGQLKGYRIPGSRDRRIPIYELLRFMHSHNIPTDSLDLGKLKILIVDSDSDYAKSVTEIINNNPKYQADYAINSFEAGLMAQKTIPNVIVVNLMSNNINAEEICKAVRISNELQGGKVVAIVGNLSDREIKAVLDKGFDSYVSNPADISELIGAIEDASSIFS